MTVRGVDEAWARVDPQTLLNNGLRFIIGYVSQDNTGKNITAAEIQAAHNAGLDVCLVYEFNPKSALGGYAQGVADAGIAINGAQTVGYPQTCALYAAVDWDVTDAQKPVVLAYATGFRDRALNAGYHAGIYSGYWTCKYLKDNNYSGHLWQTYAWSGGLWLPGVHIKQIQNGVIIGGKNVDIDEAQIDDFGQWPGTTNPPTPIVKDTLVNNWVTVQQGNNGDAVKVAQGLLLARGLSVGSRNGLPDGDFGPTTAASTRSLQGRYGITVDGIFGPHTASVAMYGRDVA